MTREDRAAKRAQRLRDELDAKKRQLAQIEAQTRADERARQSKRRQRVGTLAESAGLFVWEDSTLFSLFQLLTRLHATPDPVGVLESLLADLPYPGTHEDAAAASPCLLTSLQSDSSAVSR